jgi:hypothetical protein
MSTTPAGLPAWSRTADASVYGGHVDKRDFEGQGPVDPQTDVSAAQFIRLAADVAALSRVAPFAVLTIQCNDTVPAAPTVVRAQQMTAVSLAGYEGASPTGDFPTLTRVGDGEFDVVWPTSVADDYGVEQDVDLVHAHGSVHDAGTYSAVEPSRTNAYTFRFTARDDLGAAIADALVTIEVG